MGRNRKPNRTKSQLAARKCGNENGKKNAEMRMGFCRSILKKMFDMDFQEGELNFLKNTLLNELENQSRRLERLNTEK